MAKYQILVGDRTATNLYLVFMRISDGQFFNSVGFEAFNDAQVDSFYATALTQTGTTGIWSADVPSAITAQTDLAVLTYQKVGGSKSLNADTAIDVERMTWDGVKLIPLVSQTLGIAIVNAALDTAVPELSSVPSAAPTIRQALMLPFQWLRNDSDQSATTRRIKKSDGTVIASATVTDSGGITSQGKLA